MLGAFLHIGTDVFRGPTNTFLHIGTDVFRGPTDIATDVARVGDEALACLTMSLTILGTFLHVGTDVAWCPNDIVSDVAGV